MGSSLVSFSRQTKKLSPPPSIAYILAFFGAGASSGASPKFLATICGCSRQLVPPPSFAPHIRASRARAPTSAAAELSAPRSIVCCSGSSPSPVVVAVCNGRLGGEREILSDLPSKMGILKAAFFPYISAGVPDLSATAKALKVLDLCGSVIIKLSSPYSDLLADGPVIQVVPQLSSLVAFLKPNVEKFMSIVKDAGFQGKRPPRVNDVFISYKQEDMLHYVSHLKSALDRRGIKTFVDSTLEGGVEFQPAIEEAIERSRVAVVIVSRNYHLSPWCLIELEKILDCQRKWGLIVLPILRGRDAKDLREQPRHFAENIGQGEKGFKQEQPHQFQKWRDALRALGMIKALPVLCSPDIPEATVIEDAADKISARVSRSV